MVKRVHYDPEADILYILLREGPVEDTIEVAEDVFIELDERGEIVGIEIWRATKNILEQLTRVDTAKPGQQLEIKS